MRKRWRLIILLIAVCLASDGAWAHRSTGNQAPPPSAIAIPSLSHGEMQVIEENRGAILALADRQLHPDETLLRLRSFVSLQYAFCLWGKMPGSISDETSPFNECAHAYLAATKALLLHMAHMPDAAPEARILGERVNKELADQALVFCRFSGEPFNTAEIVEPRWREIPFHAASATILGTALLSLVLGLWSIWDLGRRPRAAAR